MLLLLACAHVKPPTTIEVTQVRERPAPMDGLAANLHPDRGLSQAVELLLSAAPRPDLRVTPAALRLALAHAGYARDARVVQARGTGDAPPPSLLASLPQTDIDVGWGHRTYGDQTVWMVAWAPRLGSIDPVPRDLVLDEGFALRVDGLEDPRLFVGTADGRAQELSMLPSVARWVDVFHVPGEHRIEVVDGDSVAFLFSVFVDAPLPAVPALQGAAEPVPAQQIAAELGARVNALRQSAGLPMLRPFAAYEPYVRAQAACLASVAEVAHSTLRCPGVPQMVERDWYPRAKHHENVVAADTASEAWERIYDSPGHRLNLLCDTCTHLTVGSATEPTLPARTFSVIEVMAFPEGEPMPIIRGAR